MDYECELIVVIGKTAADVPESEALNYVLGYAVGNDVSHRDWQIKHGGGQWSLGKGFDGWAPWGPGIVTSNVIKDPHNLAVWTKLNGETVQVCDLTDSFDWRRESARVCVTDWSAVGQHRRHDIQHLQDHRLPEPRHNALAGRPDIHRDVSADSAVSRA